jgi:ribonucleotide reductase alpha subunit
MKFIIEEYRVNNWWFATDDSYDKNKYQNNKYDMCNEYIIFNNTCASSSKVNKEDSKLEELLNKYKPIRSEIMHLSDNLSGSYSSFIGSHASKGELQFDLWSAKVDNTRYDWDKLKSSIIQYGIRNSLLCAPMPTASTSQILGNNECFEPITSNIYSRRTLAGEFIIVNKYLVNELLELGIWNDNMKQMIIKNKGSIKNISNIPDSIKDKYKTAWEIPMRHLIDMSRDRGIFICQSQSLNLWVEDPEPKGLTNMHFYAWRAGLKTGIYYLRRKPKYDAQQFTIEPEKISTNNNNNNNNNNNESDCLMCSG